MKLNMANAYNRSVVAGYINLCLKLYKTYPEISKIFETTKSQNINYLNIFSQLCQLAKIDSEIRNFYVPKGKDIEEQLYDSLPLDIKYEIASNMYEYIQRLKYRKNKFNTNSKSELKSAMIEDVFYKGFSTSTFDKIIIDRIRIMPNKETCDKLTKSGIVKQGDDVSVLNVKNREMNNCNLVYSYKTALKNIETFTESSLEK